MQEIAFQKKGDIAVPHSIVDRERWAEYKENQITHHKTTGVRKQRSYRQLKLYFACCETVAQNTEDKQWDTKEKVDKQCRVALQFIDLKKTIVTKDGDVIPHYKSISFKNLGHIMACRYFDRAFEVMAKELGVTVTQLTQNAERHYG